MKKKILLLAALLLQACQPEPNTVPHQEEILEIAWYGFFDTEDTAPETHWKMGAELDCNVPDGRRGWTYYGKCVAGIYEPPSLFMGHSGEQVEVAWDGEIAISSTSLCHEMFHYRLQKVRKDPDGDHTQDHIWDSDHNDTGGLVAECKRALEEAGY